MNASVMRMLLLIALGLAPASGQAQTGEPDSADQIQSRSVKVFGCEISMDVNAGRRQHIHRRLSHRNLAHHEVRS